MADALERFFNWQMDMDWSWGPLLYLRPPRNVRLTLVFWLKLLGSTLLFAVVSGAVLGSLLIYYDYAAARHHDTKILPVVVTENWINSVPLGDVLEPCFLILAVALLWLFPTHWAWNRRADRLNRGLSQPLPTLADVSGIWPPPPAEDLPNL